MFLLIMGKKEATHPKLHEKKHSSKKRAVTITFLAVGAIIIAFLLILLVIQIGVHKIKAGDTVTLDYTGYLEDGKVFDSSLSDVALENKLDKKEFKPLTFKVGSGEVIPGFDEAVKGLTKGSTTTFEVTPEQGYGSI